MEVVLDFFRFGKWIFYLLVWIVVFFGFIRVLWVNGMLNILLVGVMLCMFIEFVIFVWNNLDIELLFFFGRC